MSRTTYEVMVYDNGNIEWRLDGKLHRTDGPAVEWNDGTRQWYLNDQLHRVGGPAAEYADGGRYWSLEGQEYTEAEYHEKLRPDPCEGKTVTIDGVIYTLNRAKE